MYIVVQKNILQYANFVLLSALFKANKNFEKQGLLTDVAYLRISIKVNVS